MYSAPMSGASRRAEGARCKRDGHVRRHGSNSCTEDGNNWKPTSSRSKSVDTSTLKTHTNLSNIKVTTSNQATAFISLPITTANLVSVLTGNNATSPTSLRGSKVWPAKFDSLMEEVKALEMKHLEDIIDLIFERATDDPNFSEAYANMCNELFKLKVPADTTMGVSFRELIMSRCQIQILTEKTNESVKKLEDELSECTDPVKKEELIPMLAEETRKIRLRSVGNVRFIGELYNLKLLTSKVMVYCMKNLVDKPNLEEKLECLCELLTKFGEQVEGEKWEQLEVVFKKMQEIVDYQSSNISSRLRCMIQDVIKLRKRRWVVKSVVDSQPKIMDQIQREAEQHQRQVELMNSAPMSSGSRRAEGARSKRGSNIRRHGSNSFMEEGNNSVDSPKLKNLCNMKLTPLNPGYSYGSSIRNTATTNMYSVLANPTSLRGSKGDSLEKFDNLIDNVKALENKLLQDFMDLIFEKAMDDPNSSKAYANMCNELYKLKMPTDATLPDQCFSFRELIINRCQTQFLTDKTNEAAEKLEQELSDCTDPVKKQELTLMLAEENRKVRMRSVGSVPFIAELYNLQLLTSKFMVNYLNYLVNKLDEKKLECLCELLTNIGEQVEREKCKQLYAVFKKMQAIVDHKSSNISSSVRFMIQDVIELRRRRWAVKSVVDSQPKMMDQIQRDQHQRLFELMYSAPMSAGSRRAEGGRSNHDGHVQRHGSNSSMEGGNNWRSTLSNLGDIKLTPSKTGRNIRASSKTTATTTMYSVLARAEYNLYTKTATNLTSLRTCGSGSCFSSMEVPRASSDSCRTSPPALAGPLAPVLQEPLTHAKKKTVKSVIDLLLINLDDKEVVLDVKQLFPPQFHAAVVSEILNVCVEKSLKDIAVVSKALLHLVSSGTISTENLLAGFNEIFELAPDLYIDIPMLYDYFGKLVAPQIETKNVAFFQIFGLCRTIISSNHGHLFLGTLIKELKESVDLALIKSKWQESGVELKEWMSEDQVPKFIEENKFKFLEDSWLTDGKKKTVKSVIDLFLINLDEKEVVLDVKQLFPPQFHAAVVSEILNVGLEKSLKEIAVVSKALLHLVSSGTISTENLLAGFNEIFELAPDSYIDIPMIYDYFGKLVAPQIETKNVTFVQIFGLCGTIISSNHGHLFLRALINDLKESVGPTIVKSKWQESGVELKEWMSEDQVPKFIEENKFEFLEDCATPQERLTEENKSEFLEDCATPQERLTEENKSEFLEDCATPQERLTEENKSEFLENCATPQERLTEENKSEFLADCATPQERLTEENKSEFLEDYAKASEETKSKLLQITNSDETCECTQQGCIFCISCILGLD